MDINGDGRVSFNEFTHFLNQNGYTWVNPQLFGELDANRDGGLDFWEVLTFYYIVKTRGVLCDVCRSQLHGLYFTCVSCFDHAHDSYDLCGRCYSGRMFRHHHSVFLDSYLLLRSKRGISPGININMAIIQPQRNQNRNKWFGALEMALNVGNLLNVGNVVGCTIM
ncbi:hypothetical protein UlMin_010089 [Ulmus minor]